MKSFLIFSLSLISFSVSAAWNELECEGFHNRRHISFVVEAPFPRGAYFKKAQLTVTEDGAQKTYDYTVSTMNITGISRMDYTGNNIRVEVDYRPDRSPRRFWNYYGSLMSKDLNNLYIRGLRCQFL